VLAETGLVIGLLITLGIIEVGWLFLALQPGHECRPRRGARRGGAPDSRDVRRLH